MNIYLQDVPLFFQKAAKLISTSMSKIEIVEGGLFFSLGIERLLKGILFDINPIYVFKEQTFKNTAPILYKDKIISKNNEVSEKPNSDVLTFKISLLWAKIFSKATENNSNLLFSLANFRDIIAHCPLTNLDFKKLEVLLMRDFYQVVEDYAREIGEKLSTFLGVEETRLYNLSNEIKAEQQFNKIITEKIQLHEKKWRENRQDSDYIKQAKDKTDAKSQEDGYKKVSCPACKNEALISIESVYDGDILTGEFISSLNCFYCELIIDTYEEFDFIGL